MELFKDASQFFRRVKVVTAHLEDIFSVESDELPSDENYYTPRYGNQYGTNLEDTMMMIVNLFPNEAGFQVTYKRIASHYLGDPSLVGEIYDIVDEQTKLVDGKIQYSGRSPKVEVCFTGLSEAELNNFIYEIARNPYLPLLRPSMSKKS
tara:strand:+ start:27168 stop:27617 length:450 start_codon:yes stop_codon:yes gene_type:complete